MKSLWELGFRVVSQELSLFIAQVWALETRWVKVVYRTGWMASDLDCKLLIYSLYNTFNETLNSRIEWTCKGKDLRKFLTSTSY